MRINPIFRLIVVGASMALILAACGDDTGGTGDNGDGGQAGESLLEQVKSRGMVRCGVNDALPGFGFQDEQANFAGFDVEFCKAVAAGVLGDPTKVEFTALTAEQRFTALQSAQVDVLIRNTTWTATRDGSEGAAFATTTFYDGQGMMVKDDSRIRRLEDMGGTTVCVLSGTTTELNLDAQFKARGIAYEPLSFEDNPTLQQAFVQNRCQGWTTDKSGLAGLRSNFPEAQGGAESLRILDVTMSKEPLGPVVRDGDSDWFDAVNWIVIALIQAEEFGVTQANVQQTADTSTDPEVQRLLGVSEGQPFDPGLGLDADFVVNVIKAVGNYGEIYDRTIGPDTALGLARGPNALWTDGGLMYAPPYR